MVRVVAQRAFVRHVNGRSKTLFQPILSQVEDGSIDASFDKKPYQLPVKPLFVEDMTHSTHRAYARIVQHANGFYQVAYSVYAANGRYFPVSTPSISADPDYEWGIAKIHDETGNRVNTMADSLPSAQEIAERELNLIVDRDPEIQHRTGAVNSENQSQQN